jgi:hypothetical protein
MDARIIPDQVEAGRPGMTNVFVSASRFQPQLRDLAAQSARVFL